MRTLGLIGGMSWQSTVAYYRLINEAVAARLGGHHSARLLLHSVDFAEIEACQREDRWGDAARILVGAARSLEVGGAEVLVLCTNTMHRMADIIRTTVSLPLLHIADATAGAIAASGVRRVALLGTRYTMEQDFYRGRLEARHGLEVLVPDEAGRAEVNRVIYDELCHGRVESTSRARFAAIIDELVARGAAGVILGCTEIGLLVRPEDAPVPVFDTTEIHARAAANWALS